VDNPIDTLFFVESAQWRSAIDEITVEIIDVTPHTEKNFRQQMLWKLFSHPVGKEIEGGARIIRKRFS
jgi:hypothetical protein